MPTDGIDIGYNHTIRYFQWAPDRDLNPQYDGIPDEPRCGVIIDHLQPNGFTPCSGAINFDTPVTRLIMPEKARWTVISFEPLTTEPSILCQCGDHGYITDGRWVPCW